MAIPLVGQPFLHVSCAVATRGTADKKGCRSLKCALTSLDPQGFIAMKLSRLQRVQRHWSCQWPKNQEVNRELLHHSQN